MSSKRRKSSLTKTETRGELEFCVFIFLGRPKNVLGLFSAYLQVTGESIVLLTKFFPLEKIRWGREALQGGGWTQEGRQEEARPPQIRKTSVRESLFSHFIFYIHTLFLFLQLWTFSSSLFSFLPCRSKHHLDADHFKKASSHKKGSHHHEDGGKGIGFDSVSLSSEKYS